MLPGYEFTNLQFFSTEQPQFTVSYPPGEDGSAWQVECVVLDLAYHIVRTVTSGAGITAGEGRWTVLLGDPLDDAAYYYQFSRTVTPRVLAAGVVTVFRAL